tara:strand:+ start:13706 stop:14086 length:381 start_codon:yes stop_codon:yes gene_type:complete
MLTVPVSVGELIDKLSILQVKKLKITNPEGLKYVSEEFELLYNQSETYFQVSELKPLYESLTEVNSTLWDVEDKLRVFESEKKFDQEFIELARKVYYTNDERFRLKNKINSITSSEIREVKDYKPY